MTRSPVPSTAELADLEHAYATDPSGEAYRPLAEAYLQMGRYMEAMVVCKKGARALPRSPEPHFLLARIQRAQGRNPKAIEELRAALERDAAHLPSLKMLAELLLEAKEEEGKSVLARALELDPDDPDLARLAAAHGVARAAPAPAPVAPEKPASAVSPTPAPAPEAEVEAEDEPEPEPEPEPRPAPRPAPAAPRAQRLQPVASAPTVGRIADLAAWDEEDGDVAGPSRRREMRRFAITAAVLLVALGGWYGYAKMQAAKEREVAKLLQRTGDLVRKDGYGAYRDATEAAREILDHDRGNAEAHAYLAYVLALRWGEQGEGEDLHRQARQHLEEAERRAPDHPRVIAAKALLAFFEGDPATAETILGEAVGGRRRAGLGLLYETLGRIRMESGELDAAAEALREAQGYDFNNPRLLSALGVVHWRRGSAPEAWAVFDSALRVDPTHADSLLGRALLVLDSLETRSEEDRKRLLEEAASQVAKVLELPSGSISTRQLARAKFAQGQIALARGDESQGRRLEQEAFALDPRNADIRVLRGRRLLREGKAREAARDLEEALSMQPRLATYVDLFDALRGEPSRLVAAMEEATRRFPRSGRAWVLLGDARRVANDASGARAAYERAIEVGDGMAEARVRLAALHRDAREWEKARVEVERALAALGRRTGSAAAQAHTELGRIFEEGERDVVKAFESYANALAAWENFAPAYFHIGRISARQASAEQRKQAVESLETYLRLDPRGESAAEARRLLATLR
ncbi:MAG TPA: tetratricopeptide repeat protein [Fredinandcohnia sp.]|nr:tetratricopeptide repeat protein [Fredinandcohnia sp.]